jgi:F-type H+-transporting ATPase subunit epsilon
LLANGELRIKKGGSEQSIVVFGGFIEVTPEKVIVLADSAERAEEIDVDRAEAARRSAEELKARRETGVDLAEADLALRRASVRLRVGQRRRPQRGPGMPTGSDNEF